MTKNVYIKIGLSALLVVITIQLIAFTPSSYKDHVLNKVTAARFKADKGADAEKNLEINEIYANAGNSTLGFEKVLFINIPSRYDRYDALTLQSQMTGLTFEHRDAVPLQELEEKKMVGIAPASNPSLTAGQQACLRSHANVWREMLDEGWNSMVVLESDSTWDMNLRVITQRMAQALHQLIEERSQTLNGESTPTKDDPWDTNQWDYISFGACMESHNRSDIYLAYPDVDSPDAEYVWKEDNINITLRNERVVRRSGSPVCTGAYAISRSGAMKFLLRQAIDTNTPVDLMIAEVIHEGRAVAYVPYPPLIYQWEYVSGIGAEDRNSDIDYSRKTNVAEDVNERWKTVRKEWNIWKYNGMFSGRPFKHWVLSEMHKYILPFS